LAIYITPTDPPLTPVKWTGYVYEGWGAAIASPVNKSLIYP